MGFSTRQVPRWSLTCTRKALVFSFTHASDELNSVQFRKAKASSPLSYTHMPSKACETLLYPFVSHILHLVRLPGEYRNSCSEVPLDRHMLRREHVSIGLPCVEHDCCLGVSWPEMPRLQHFGVPTPLHVYLWVACCGTLSFNFHRIEWDTPAPHTMVIRQVLLPFPAVVPPLSPLAAQGADWQGTFTRRTTPEHCDSRRGLRLAWWASTKRASQAQ